ncbi:MAG: hypothetical protein AAF618_01615 [Pseudomonadota bacterium]
MLKAFEVLRYHLLYRRYAGGLLLDKNRFRGARVLLAGPARTLEADLAALDPARFDVIAKMNYGLVVPLPAAQGPTLRCDLLFHSLSQDIAPVSEEALARAGVRCLVHRTTGKGRFPQTLEASRRFGLAGVAVRLIAPERYKALEEALGGASPTTGLVALDFLMGCALAELAVVGFTFFQTKYQPGYDDRDATDAQSLDRVRRAAHHDPAAERRLVGAMIAAARAEGKTIRLGEGVAASLGDAP